MKKRVAKGLFLLFVVLILGSCAKKQVAPIEIKEQIFNIVTESVSKGDISDYIKLGGDVTTETNIDVYPEVQYGKIIQINVAIGEYVRKGQILVVVDPSQPGYTYASNPVKAPITGYVTALYAQLGAVVSGQIPVVKIGVLDNPKDIYVKTFVPEKYVSSVKKGTTAEIIFSYADKPFKAKVLEVTPVLDPMSRTFEIWLRFNHFDSDIRVGSYPDIKLFIKEKKNVVVVPLDAVLNRNGNMVVFLYTEIEGKGIARMIPVETGIRIDGQYEITKGLVGGEDLIVKGNSLLLDGVAIRKVILD